MLNEIPSPWSIPAPHSPVPVPGFTHVVLPPGATFQPLNPDLSRFPEHLAGQAAALALSPDGRTLLVLTSGYNLMFGDDGKPIPAASMEYVFVYDASGAAPVKRQVVRLPNSFLGLDWSPSGERFYVSGGVDDPHADSNSATAAAIVYSVLRN